MLRTTLIGGILFLIPLGILVLILSKVFELALFLVDPIAELFPKEDYLGISIGLILAVILLLVVCFVAGMMARSAMLSGVSARTNQLLEAIIPGYRMLRARIAATISDNNDIETPKVITATVGGLRRYGLLMHEFKDSDEALVFLPGAPNTESGILGKLPMSEIEFEDMPAHKMEHAFRFYGRDLYETEQTLKK